MPGTNPPRLVPCVSVANTAGNSSLYALGELVIDECRNLRE